ncbi:CHAT domain-containing protein [Cyanothece sp. BG0011]|uniref:nSTAND1 domain-containing NTPase n=1 Tax=Cyanothece sp. BG0011 TaxID=2082950 RepID=UPI000D1D6E48|nr:CHAT domain-containing protein [Cyanothece sp. BG0011]
MILIINFGKGNLEEGFSYITLQLWSDYNPFPQQFTSCLPANPDLKNSCNQWRLQYDQYRQRNSFESRNNLDDDEDEFDFEDSFTNFSEVDFVSFSNDLLEAFNQWLNSDKFSKILKKIAVKFQPNEAIRLILNTDNDTLKRLPWSGWEFLNTYPNSEISLSRSHYIREEINIKLRNKVRILAIIGNTQGINVDQEKQWLNQLPDAEVYFLEKPDKDDVKTIFSDTKGWDILFFAGHSHTKENTGILSINYSQDTNERDITINELTSHLKEAIKNGLQVAIFNSCDGLGIGDGLASLYIPITIIMREPVPNKVAQDFFHEFLDSYANKKLSLYIAIKNARKKLKTLENNYLTASWLPMMFQNPAFSPPSWVELGGFSPCPYLGLNAFQESNCDLFFGRETTVNELEKLVNQNSFISLVGASGSGKSSVIFAGLIPKLRQDTNKNWRISWFRPNDNPFEGFVKAISQLTNNSSDRFQELQLEVNLENDTTAISNYLNQIIQNSSYSSHLLLVIDQFEELFTISNQSQREAFLNSLLTAIHTVDKLTVIITLRADFLGNLLNSVQWGELLQQYPPQYITSMNRKQLKSAIIKPAGFNGVKLEDQLVDQLIDDVYEEAGYLPLLQFTLTELWKQQKKGLLTYADYEKIGGVKTALANYAESVYQQFSTQEKEKIQTIFIQLVTLQENNEPTRKIATITNNLIKENWQLITRLASSRLVITNSLEKEITVEIAHEKLIIAWPRYYQWIQNHQDFLRWRSQLSNHINQWKNSLKIKQNKPLKLGIFLDKKIKIWQNYQQEKGYLLKDTPLINAKTWYNQRLNELGEEEKQFIETSLKLRRNQRIIISLVTTMIMGTISLTSLFAWLQSKERQLEQLIRYASSQVITPENINIIIDVLPDYLNSAEDREKSNKIEQAIDDYRQILRVANNSNEKVKQDPTMFQNLSIIQDKLQKISQQAEASLAEIIAIYRLPTLEKQLNNQQFGERKISQIINPDADTIEYDYTQTIYTGALKTTHDLIMSDRGVKTDQNNNNIIDEGEEKMIPCQTLIQIEKLWRKATDNQCGWYGEDNIWQSNCQLFEGNTLTNMLMYPSDIPLLENRLNQCKIL